MGGSYVFNQLAQATVTSHLTLRAANHIVAIWQQAGDISGRIRHHVQNMPDILRTRERRPLQRKTKRRRIRRDRNKDLADLRAFRAEDSKTDVCARAIAQFLDEEAGLWVVLYSVSARQICSSGRCVCFRTIVRPLIPMMESNHGSRGSSGFVLRRTWKPYAPATPPPLCFWAVGSASRREMNLFRAPNMFAIVVGWFGWLCLPFCLSIIAGAWSLVGLCGIRWAGHPVSLDWHLCERPGSSLLDILVNQTAFTRDLVFLVMALRFIYRECC